MQKMDYINRITIRHPGLVIFMIDNSAMGYEEGICGKSCAEIAAEIVNSTITAMEILCIRHLGHEEEEVRNFFDIAILGYGRELTNVDLLYIGSITHIADNFPIEGIEENGAFRKVYRKIVDPMVGYDSPLAIAFEEAQKLMVEWRKEHNNELTPSPLIINVTHGELIMEQGNSKDDIYMSVSKIIGTHFPDGAPIICNIITHQIDEYDESFPNKDNTFSENSFAHMYYSISSNMPDSWCPYFQNCFDEKVFKDSKLLLTASDRNMQNYISKIINSYKIV